MVKFLFIAEKPSLAKEVSLARATQTGARATSRDGYIEVGDDAVTWLIGHMYELAPPEVYDPAFKIWRFDPLPIVPGQWKRVYRKKQESQLRKVNALLQQAEKIVNVGDAAREGQLLVDEVLIEAGIDPFSPSVMRMWVRSMTAKDMAEALANLIPNSEKKSLFDSAFARQKADWLHGLNLSRCYTLLARQSGIDATISVGRVMTPTMKLVVDRDKQIENFKAVDYFVPGLNVEHANGRFRVTWIAREDGPPLDADGRLLDINAAREIVEGLAGKTGIVRHMKVARETQQPKLPYSLSALQIDCSAKFGLTAKQTLDICQALYEHRKIISYPRSDSRYLPITILTDEAADIVANLGGAEMYSDFAARANLALRSPAWNDAKVSDHHAIIPTTSATASVIDGLVGHEKQVFGLIAKAFLAQFFPPYVYEKQRVEVAFGRERFEARGRRQVSPGWRYIFGAEADDDDQADEETALPQMQPDDKVIARSFQVQSKRTQPPSRFTDGTLIEAMTNVHRFVTDPNIKKHLREKDGLGTEATRGAILEKLVVAGVLLRKKKFIHSSNLGRSICDVIPLEIQDPGMTALWEGALDKIVEGKLSAEEFMQAQEKMLRKRIEQARTNAFTMKGVGPEPLTGHGEDCPACHTGKMVTRVARGGAYAGKRYLSCNRRPDCKHIGQLEGYKAPEPLPGHGETCPACKNAKLVTRSVVKGANKGRRFLSCSSYPACTYASAGDTGKIDPLPGHGETCTHCKKGTMQTRVAKKGPAKGSRFLSCSSYPECKHVVSSGVRRRNVAAIS